MRKALVSVCRLMIGTAALVAVTTGAQASDDPATVTSPVPALIQPPAGGDAPGKPGAPANAGAPAAPSAEAPASSDLSPGKMPASIKRLSTIPDDGMPSVEAPIPSKFVRDLIAAHPNEDLIICVAGCFANRDKIIFSQAIEPPAAKTPVAQAAPAPLPGVAVEREPSAAKEEPGLAAKPAPQHDKTSAKTLPQKGWLPSLMPTMAEPAEADPHSEQPSPAADAPAADAPAGENQEPAQ